MENFEDTKYKYKQTIRGVIMRVKDIKNASSIKNLTGMVKTLPMSLSATIVKLFKLKTQEERTEYLKTLPEETLKYLLKASTYVILASGVVIKESTLEVYMTPEINDYFKKVKAEVDRVGEVTKETVSLAVDVVIGTVSTVVIVGVIALTVFMMLNPAIAAATLGASLGVMMFVEVLAFMLPSSDPNRYREPKTEDGDKEKKGFFNKRK